MANIKSSGKRGYSKEELLPLLSLPGLGLIILFFAAYTARDYWPFLGTLLITGFASCLAGLLPGFLFGIPRVNKDYKPFEGYESKRKYDPNTNLEDISDWLTKIIVGVSLTQITKIPEALEGMANKVLGTALETMPYGKAVVIATIIYFAITGFILGYFYTRMLLPRLLTISEENELLASEKDKWKKVALENKPAAPDDLKKWLTPQEIELIKAVGSRGNEWLLEQPLTIDEQSAAQVLIDKGILSLEQGQELSTGARLSIPNPEALQSLFDEPGGD